MDVHCCKCGEPWDQYYLRHELDGETPEMLADDGWQFGHNRLVVMHCPSCPKDGSGLPNAGERAAVVNELAQVLGDDLDGLAATLEDFGM